MRTSLSKKVAARRPFKVGDWKLFTSKLRWETSVYGCVGNFKQAKRVLSDMKIKLDVLPYCEDNGGHCDCEILMNVEPPTKFDFPETRTSRRETQRGGKTR